MSTPTTKQYEELTAQVAIGERASALLAERLQAAESENTRLREALRTIAANTQSAQVKFVAEQALAAGKGTSPDLSADPAAYDRIADRELGPAAGKGEMR